MVIYNVLEKELGAVLIPPKLDFMFEGGHWGILETTTPKKKSSKTARSQINSAKTENRRQSRQKPIQW